MIYSSTIWLVVGLNPKDLNTDFSMQGYLRSTLRQAGCSGNPPSPVCSASHHTPCYQGCELLNSSLTMLSLYYSMFRDQLIFTLHALENSVSYGIWCSLGIIGA